MLLGANKKTLFSLSIKNAKSIFKTKRKELALIKRQFLKKRYFLRGEMVQNNPPYPFKRLNKALAVSMRLKQSQTYSKPESN
ncbi:hypothetical protein HpSLK91_04300 [Helicobacter pylori]